MSATTTAAPTCDAPRDVWIVGGISGGVANVLGAVLYLLLRQVIFLAMPAQTFCGASAFCRCSPLASS